MDITETTRLCRAIASIKPAQHMDDETPAFWSLILAGVRYEDARQAVITLGGKQRFIDPSDILAEVKRVRTDRIERAGEEAISELTMRLDGDRRAAIRAIADGTVTPPRPVGSLQDQRAAAALSGVLRRPPSVSAAIEGGPRPARQAPAPTLTQHDADALEAERARQQAALTRIEAAS